MNLEGLSPHLLYEPQANVSQELERLYHYLKQHNILLYKVQKFFLQTFELDRFTGELLIKAIGLKMTYGKALIKEIGRTIMQKPKMILADEPTSSLDDFNCNNVIKLLKKQAKDHNAQLIVITHDARLKKHFKNNLNL